MECFEGKSYVLNIAIDRLWLDFTHKNFQATLGRQRINWSQTFVWNPNDLFNTYSYFDFDYEEKPGSDAVRLQYFTSASSKAELLVKAGKDKKVTAAALYRFNKWKYDFQGLAGIFNPLNNMVFVIPTFTCSLMNNLDLSLVAQTFESYSPATVSASQTSVFLRLKGSF